MLSEPDIRQELNTVISGASAPVSASTRPSSGRSWRQILSTRAGAAVLGPLMKETHDKIVGNRDDDIVLTGNEMIPIVRDERAGDVPT